MPSWMSPSSVPTAALLAAEGQLARRGDLQAHLLLDVGDVDAVALAELTGLEVDGVLRQHEQGQALGAGAGALGAGQDEVDDVVDHVGLGARDEALDAGDGPRAVAVVDRLGAAGADVGPGIRLGEHHRAVPALVGDPLRELLLVVVAEGVQQLGEAVGRGEHRDRRVRAEQHLVDTPAHARRHDGATQLGVEVDAPEAAVAVGVEGLRERLGHRHRLRLRVVDGRVAVGVLERRGELVLGQAGDLLEHLARGVDVHLLVGAGAQHVAAAEHLEEVELDVTQVALVVAHDGVPPGCR